MIRYHRLLGGIVLILGFSCCPAPPRAQERYNFTSACFGGLGGSFDAEPGDSLSNTGYQVNLAHGHRAAARISVLRVGQLALDEDEFFGSLTDAELSYATVGGEYRFRDLLRFGDLHRARRLPAGGYGFDGRRRERHLVGARDRRHGRVPINHWLGILAELSGHYMDFDEAQSSAWATWACVHFYF